MTATLERGLNALREQIDAPVASFFTSCVSCGLCAEGLREVEISLVWARIRGTWLPKPQQTDNEQQEGTCDRSPDTNVSVPGDQMHSG